jgi:hypothetical protein
LLKAWKIACRAAHCPGKIPHELSTHDGGPEPRARWCAKERRDGDDGAQNAPRVLSAYNITSPGNVREAVRKLDVSAAGSYQAIRSRT